MLTGQVLWKWSSSVSSNDAVCMCFLTPTRNMFAGKFVNWVRFFAVWLDCIFHNVEWAKVREINEVFWAKLRCKMRDSFYLFLVALRFSARKSKIKNKLQVWGFKWFAFWSRFRLWYFIPCNFFFFCRLLRPWLLKSIYLLGQTYLVWQTHYNTKNTHSILLFSTTISNIFQKQSSRGKYLSEKSGYILRNSDSNMFQKWQRKNHEEFRKMLLSYISFS